MNKKVLIIGLGSMGQRRIRNLHALNITDIYGYDKKAEVCNAVAKEYKINIVKDFENLSEYKFNFAVIATDPQFHLINVNHCIKNKVPFFTEFNLITKDVISIAKHIKKAKILGIPSNTEYYDHDIWVLKRELAKKSSGYFLFHLGQNMSDWHPWQKPGEHFIFQQDTNGIREFLRTELPWIIDFFGEIKIFSASNKNLFTNKFKINDFICLQLEFVRGIYGVIVFDLVSPCVIKRFTMVDDKETITWDERNNIIEKCGLKSKKKINLRNKTILSNYKFHEDAHLLEMKNVVNIFNGKSEPLYTFLDEIKLLKLIDKIENFYV